MAHLPHLRYHRLPGESHTLTLTLTTTAGEGPQDAADVTDAIWTAATLGTGGTVKAKADGVTVTDGTDSSGADAIVVAVPVDRADTLNATLRMHRWTLDFTDASGDRFPVYTGVLDLRTNSTLQRA